MGAGGTTEAARDPSIPIRARRKPTCWLCESGGGPLFSGLRDYLFDAPGAWTLRRCHNPACRMVWLDPIPLEEDIHHAYRTYYTHTSAVSTTGLRSRIREAVTSGYLQGTLGYAVGAPWHGYLRLLAYVYPTGASGIEIDTMFLPAPRFPARLLDVGCGNGDLALRMRSLGWDVEAVELDPVAVQTARARGLEVRQGALERQHYPPDSFDAVTMSHLIEHVYDPPGLLQEARRILKPGGTLVVLTPNSQSLGARLYGQDWRGWEPPRHLHLFTVDSMRVMLERAGLTRIAVTTVARGARDILASSARLRRQRLAGIESRATDTSWSWCAHLGLQYAERLLTALGKRTGEELLAIARKSP